MSKTTRLILVLALASMVIIAGCKKQEEAADATAMTATTETATTETATTTATMETTATTVAAETSGVPECDAYLAAVHKYMACDKVPQVARDAQKQARDQMRSGWASWSSLPEDSRKMAQTNAATACTSALSSLKVAASASGCPIE